MMRCKTVLSAHLLSASRLQSVKKTRPCMKPLRLLRAWQAPGLGGHALRRAGPLSSARKRAQVMAFAVEWMRAAQRRLQWQTCTSDWTKSLRGDCKQVACSLGRLGFECATIKQFPLPSKFRGFVVTRQLQTVLGWARTSSVRPTVPSVWLSKPNV